MKKSKIFIILFLLINTYNSYSQCDYDTLSLQITHLNCYEVPTGEIDLFVPNTNASFTWQGPVDLNTNIAFSSTSIPITNLYAGDYVLTISEYTIPGDVTSNLICQMSDTFTVNQTNDIVATYVMRDNCNNLDSADVIISVTGGTPYNSGELYNYQIFNSSSVFVGNNDTLLDLPSDMYILNITDENGCQPSSIQEFEVPIANQMNTFMSSVNVPCKDENSGEARVFVHQGTPPFIFDWGDNYPIIEHDSFSVINDLSPGYYTVKITDHLGCLTFDSVEVLSNPKNCLVVYKAFSPNDDDIHEFWEIEKIELYPEALVAIYSRDGNEVYRRRNYQNIENIAFTGKNKKGQSLPSGVYYYVIDLGNEYEILKGSLTIVR